MHQGQTCYDKSPSVAYLALRCVAIQARLGGPVTTTVEEVLVKRAGWWGRGADSPLAVIYLKAGEVEVHDFALELKGLRKGVCGKYSGR